jgi:hypothetical protein
MSAFYKQYFKLDAQRTKTEDLPVPSREWDNLDNSIIKVSLLGPECGYWENEHFIITYEKNGKEEDLLRAAWDAEQNPVLVLEYSPSITRGWHLQLFEQPRPKQTKVNKIKFVQMRQEMGIDGREKGVQTRPVFVGINDPIPVTRLLGNIPPIAASSEDDDGNCQEDDDPTARRSPITPPTSQPERKRSKMERDIMNFNEPGRSAEEPRKRRSNNSMAVSDGNDDDTWKLRPKRLRTTSPISQSEQRSSKMRKDIMAFKEPGGNEQEPSWRESYNSTVSGIALSGP